MQSPNPANILSLVDLPKSAANLVLAKSNGYTTNNDIDPAIPPLNKFPKKNLILCFT